MVFFDGESESVVGESFVVCLEPVDVFVLGRFLRGRQALAERLRRFFHVRSDLLSGERGGVHSDMVSVF